MYVQRTCIIAACFVIDFSDNKLIFTLFRSPTYEAAEPWARALSAQAKTTFRFSASAKLLQLRILSSPSSSMRVRMTMTSQENLASPGVLTGSRGRATGTSPLTPLLTIPTRAHCHSISRQPRPTFLLYGGTILPAGLPSVCGGLVRLSCAFD